MRTNVFLFLTVVSSSTVQQLFALETECSNVTLTRAEASRYGNCVPYINDDPTPCDVLYTVGEDYVYVPFTRTDGSIRELNDFTSDSQLVVDFLPDECLESARKLLCFYYFPPCGNSTHFQPPQSICQEQCDYFANDVCSDFIDAVYQYFDQRPFIDELGLQFINCNDTGAALEPLDYCCSDANIVIRPATVASPASTSAVDTGGSATTGRVELEAVLPPVLVAVALIVSAVVFIAVVIVRVSRKRKSAQAAVAAVSTVSTTGDRDKLQSPPPLNGIWSSATPPLPATPVARYISNDVNIWLRPVKGNTGSPRGVKATSAYLRSMSEEKLLIPGRHIQLLDRVGQGEFGVVYRGHLTGWEDRGSADLVAVKTLRDIFSPKDINDLMAESLKMQKFDHRNVLNLIGVCIDAGPAPYLLLPFMAAGSLLSYLKKERPHLTIAPEASEELVISSEKKLLSICLQIAKGMQYLAEQKFVHRDLAARNCMIDGNFVIKVADFGLSEDIYALNYFRQGQLKDEGEPPVKLPVRWMALESLTDGIFTEKTDVWSFGVTMWEVFSLGKTPYPAVDPLALVKLLERGQRLDKPINAACTTNIFEVVLTCWDSYADKRPTFTDLVLSITMLLEGISGYMDFSAVSGAGGEALPGYDSLEPKTNLSGATYDHLQTEETPNH